MARPSATLDLRHAAAALTDGAGRMRPMSAIAAELGIAKPTLFKLVASREELVARCVEAEAERLLGRLPGLEARAGRGGARAWLDALVDDVDDLVLPVLFAPGAAGAVRRIEDRLAEVLRRAGAAPAGLPSDEAAAALLGAAVAVVRRRYSAIPSRPT